LESTKESNSTRSASLEAQIQSRVQAELARLESRSESLQAQVESELQKQGLLAEKEGTNLSSVTLAGDIRDLRDKFVGVKELSADGRTHNAREQLVRCLQKNHRRSLDCWWEVRQFKDSVARLEREFVNRHQ